MQLPKLLQLKLLIHGNLEYALIALFLLWLLTRSPELSIATGFACCVVKPVLRYLIEYEYRAR